ncbi:MAG: methionine--tRNA ligase [Nanoarchaeota archaeon]
MLRTFKYLLASKKIMKEFYITTAIDYVNAEPHIGHAYQKIIADVLARWHRLNGEEVFFLTGTDEHGQKIAKSAKEINLSEKEFADMNSEKFKIAWKKLNINYSKFIRTTDSTHKEKAYKFIEKVNHDIYKGNYEGLYCIGCEAYVTEKDLINGECPYHPGKKLEKLKEETYFFRLSKYQKKLLEFYKKNPEYILPKKKAQEIINRVKEGLNDLSITRTNISWGIPYPENKNHVIYVWFEALLNYLTGIDWPEKNFRKFWPADIQLLGVDNSWFHCVIWPAMLMSAGIEPAKNIFVHGFLTFNSQKISKSLGNGISPTTLVEKYGADTIRYYICRNFVFGEDGDFSEQALINRHNNELANKLGNLISRITALDEKIGLERTENRLLKKLNLKKVKEKMSNYEIDKALNLIFEFVDKCNEYVQEKKPWETKDKKILYELTDSIKSIAILLWPFMPEFAEKISNELDFEISINEIKRPLGNLKIKKSSALFNKI